MFPITHYLLQALQAYVISKLHLISLLSGMFLAAPDYFDE